MHNEQEPAQPQDTSSSTSTPAAKTASEASTGPIKPQAQVSLLRWFWPFLIFICLADIASKADIFHWKDTSIPIPDNPHALLIGLRHQWMDIPWIEPSFNPGVAWSMLDSYPSLVAVMTLVLIPVLAFVFWRWFRFGGRLEVLAFGSVLGGALGNGWDRFWAMFPAHSNIYGVRDFIYVDLDFPPFDPWPTFNVADIGISIGFCALVLSMFLNRNEPPQGAGAKPATASDAAAPPDQPDQPTG